VIHEPDGIEYVLWVLFYYLKKNNFLEKRIFIPHPHHIMHILIIFIENKSCASEILASSSPLQMKILSAARYPSATM
jgi:hypothetical protein